MIKDLSSTRYSIKKAEQRHILRPHFQFKDFPFKTPRRLLSHYGSIWNRKLCARQEKGMNQETSWTEFSVRLEHQSRVWKSDHKRHYGHRCCYTWERKSASAISSKCLLNWPFHNLSNSVMKGLPCWCIDWKSWQNFRNLPWSKGCLDDTQLQPN